MSNEVNTNQIPVVDIFAGPGGLSEGFSSFHYGDFNRKFKVVLSVEKEEFAHKTLRLRSFLRQFPINDLPDKYYDFLRGEITIDDLYNAFPKHAKYAFNEAWKATLGEVSNDDVDVKIRASLKDKKNWILIGGPPCQAYSIVGRSRRKQQILDSKNDERVYLYRQYYRILAVHNPPVFIMENVKGMLSSKTGVNSFIFEEIISDLENPVKAYEKLNGESRDDLPCKGYNIYSLTVKTSTFSMFGKPEFNVNDFIIKSEEYGIPQARHRVILLGIRKDLDGVIPDVIPPQDKVPLDKILQGLPPLRSGLSKGEDSYSHWVDAVKSFLKSNVISKIDNAVAEEIRKVLTDLDTIEYNRGQSFIHKKADIAYEKEWFLDEKMGGVCNHETRSHIVEDLYRYLFAAAFSKVKKTSPRLRDYPEELLPNHRNVRKEKKLNDFADRFRVQLYDQPAKTVTSHISKDGHYYIHPDPSQCRSLTVREAARVQTFPDNYFFCGNRTSQYHQVGNAVPPLLARKIAGVVAKIFEEDKVKNIDLPKINVALI